MGYMRHHAIVITSWKEDYILKAHAKAVELEMIVTSVEDSGINGYFSFMICPDGSKEGWPESDLGDDQRVAFVNWITEEQRRDAGYWEWAVLQYGDDDGVTCVTASSDERRDYLEGIGDFEFGEDDE